jgi:predicted RND superfamily exporter protein
LNERPLFPERLARRVLALRIPLIVLFVFLAVPSFLLLLRVRIDNSSDIWFRKSSDRYVRYRRFLEEFGSDRLFVVAYENENLFEPGPFETLKTVADGLRGVDGVEKVTELTAAPFVTWTPMGPIIRPFAEAVAADRAAPDEAKARALSTPLFRENLVTPDGRTAFLYTAIGPIGLEGKRKLVRDVRALLVKVDAQGGEFTVAGIPFIEVEFDRLTRRENSIFIPLSLTVIVLIILFLFRSIRIAAVVVPVLLVCVAATITAYTLVGCTFNLVTSLIPPLLLAIGVADTIHILTHYREELAAGLEAREALIRAQVKMFRPCLFTSLTTSAGFFSLAVADIPPVQTAGIFGGLGILLAFVLAFTCFPAGLSLLPARLLQGGAARPHRVDAVLARILGGAYAVSRRGRFPILALAALCIGFAVVGILRIEPETNVIRFFKADNPVRTGWKALEERGVAITAIEVVFHGEKGTFRNRRKLARIREAQEKLEEKKEIVRTFSVANVLDHALGARRETLSEEARLRAWSLALSMVEKKPPAEKRFLREFLNDDATKARLSARTIDAGSHERMRLIRWVRETLAREFADMGEVEINGTAHLFAWVEELILESQKKMAVLAGISIFLMSILLLRSIVLAALAMIPNVLPVVMTLGLMGWAKIPLDAGTILIAGVAVGIAVDDTIHYLTRFGRERAAGKGVEEALGASHLTVGQAIILTSLILFAGFAIIGFSSFRPIYTFGLLTGLTMVLALVGDLLLLPAMLLFRRTVDRRPCVRKP